ncbi:MAG: phosphoribosylglycinamide formyltransferase [Rikenellaceae bacterium]|nr:phosphoribosylglycinamide formyltransferase [Rikenellaceae bacterium]
MNKPKLKIAVFASGYGSNFEAIAKACQSGEIKAQVVLMVCDKPTARVNSLADELGVERMTFSAKDYASKAEYEAEIVERCKALGVELICLAGYMRLVGETLMEAYEGRMINIHPSLLPSFAGKDAVERAMEWGVKVYGATIHYVDSTLDGGKIIAQQAIPYEGDSIDELMAVIHPLEHQLYIDTIKKLTKQTK